MDFKQIQELIKLFNKTNIGELQIKEKDFQIKLKTREDGKFVVTTNPPVPTELDPALIPVAEAKDAAEAEKAPSEAIDVPAEYDKMHIVKSPMIGTFYRTPSPDKDAFV